MNTISLPNGQTVTIKTKMEVSEKDCRRVDDAQLKSAKAFDLIRSTGFNPDDPTTYTAGETAAKLLESANLDGPREWLKVLAEVFVDGASFPLPSDLLDLPRASYEAIINACNEAYTHVEDDSAGALVNDPKVEPSASVA